MRKFLLAGFLFLFPSVLFADAKVETEEEWTKPSSVRICKKMGDHNECGSGTVVHCYPHGYVVITCYHVVTPEQRGELLVQPVDDIYLPAEVISHWQAHDLALLYVKDKKHKVKPVRIADKEDFADGLLVCKCGYPLAGPRHVALGRCTGQRTCGMLHPNWISNACSLYTRSGDSGGGLFRNSDHSLIGVVWGGDGNIARATHLQSIHEIIKDAKKNGWMQIEEKKQIVKLKKPPQSVVQEAK